MQEREGNEKGKESGKQLGVPFLTLQITGSCSIPVAVMPAQLGTRASISGFGLLLSPELKVSFSCVIPFISQVSLQRRFRSAPHLCDFKNSLVTLG